MAVAEAPVERQGHTVVDGPILVVEDDPEVRQLIRWLLEENGQEVETAMDGKEAVAWALQQRPALVVLDLNLPIFSGEEVALALRALHGPSLPILVVSSDDDRWETARRLGASASLGKPFDIDELTQAVRHVLGRYA